MAARMLRGEPYLAGDPELTAARERAQLLLDRLNATSYDELAERERVLRQLLGRVGDRVELRPPFRCDYGRQIEIGDGTFVNFDCVMLDVTTITIGAACHIGPRAQLLTVAHPIDPVERRRGWVFGKPILVHDGVWLGAGVIVLPGVTIGPGTVVGAGAVVTRDLPAGVVALGTPARAVRRVEPSDRLPA